MSLKHKIFYKKFDSLSRKEIHDLFLLRSEVFVVEQNCVYQDIDGKDEKAEHVLVKKNNKIMKLYNFLFPFIKSVDSKIPFNGLSIGAIVKIQR